MTIETIENEIDNLLYEKLFSAIRKMIVDDEQKKIIRSADFSSLKEKDKRFKKTETYKKSFESISSFFISLKSIYSLYPLILRELQIREFISEEVIRVKVDYSYNGIDFSLYYPTHFNISNGKEITDIIEELSNSKYQHIVSNYTPKYDSEKSPHEPFTTAKLKYSAFYILNFNPDYVTNLLLKLYRSDLITDPETNGWLIDNEVANNMIVILNKIYPPEKVLQYQRAYKDKHVDRTLKECIRPKIIANKYFPKNLYTLDKFNETNFENEREKKDTHKLYELIFYITLSTQMKNSIYNESKIEVTVGSNTLSEQAFILIDNEENWEVLSGKYVNKINSVSGIHKRKTVVLPEVQLDAELKPNADAYSYSYPSQRPPRYGIGRFMTQILEKYSIGTNAQQDKIINELIESKSILLVKQMIHPQENSIFLIQWIKEYMPLLLDIEYQTELKEKILLVTAGEISLNSLLEEINRMIEDAFESCGYVSDDTPPSPSKINLLKSIAKKNNMSIDNSIYKSNVKIDMILAKFPKEKPIKIGSCPNCNSLVFQKEFLKESGEVSYYFSCDKFSKNEGGCSFSLWDNYIYKFFSSKKIELFSIEERADALKKILSKKRGYQFNSFVAKNQTEYDAKVYIESYIDRDTKKEKWNFKLKFLNNKKRN